MEMNTKLRRQGRIKKERRGSNNHTHVTKGLIRTAEIG
jgi:hypothetical protein